MKGIDPGSCAGKINSDQTAKNRVGQAAYGNPGKGSSPPANH